MVQQNSCVASGHKKLHWTSRRKREAPGTPGLPMSSLSKSLPQGGQPAVWKRSKPFGRDGSGRMAGKSH